MSTKKKKQMATKFTDQEDHSPPPPSLQKGIPEAELMMDDDHLDSSSLPIEENPNLSKEKKKKNLVKKKKHKPTTPFDPLQTDAVTPTKKRSASSVSTYGADADHSPLVAAVTSSPTNSVPAKKKRSASSTSTISAPAKKSKKTLDIGADVHNAAELVAVTPAKTSSAKKKTLDVGADDDEYSHNAADDEVLLDVTPTKKYSTPSTKKTKKTLDIGQDGYGVTQPPGTGILLPYTTSEKDGNQHSASQESPQLGARETEYVPHSSPINTRGDKTPDIDELTASNDVLAPENGISTQPLNSFSQNSVEPKENGGTPAAGGTDMVHASNIQPNVTTNSDDLLDVMVADAFDPDPPLHDVIDDSENVDINGFKVSREFKDIAREILDKHGNIFAKSSITGYVRCLVFNSVCAINDKLARFTVPELSLVHLTSMSQNVQELLKLDVEVTWLAESLEELIEMKKMQPQLRHLLKERKQKKKIVAELGKERDLQVKIAQKAKQKVDDIDIKVKTVTEEIDSIYQTIMSNVTKMQQCKHKPAKDVVGL